MVSDRDSVREEQTNKKGGREQTQRKIEWVGNRIRSERRVEGKTTNQREREREK